MTGGAPAGATPVLVGVGTAGRREDDFTLAPEPLDLMIAAAIAAGRDCGSVAALPGAQRIAVPKGRWHYRDPAAEIARAVNADRPTTVLATVGVLQQTLIADACEQIAQGRIHTALVVGGDAGHRLRRAQAAGAPLPERTQASEPDMRMAPESELRHPAEAAAGLRMPVALYAIMESARRAARGMGMAEHRAELAELMAGFSAVAADNPRAWLRKRLDAAAISQASASNPMQAFPYTRAHCSNWNVDQAAALLFCSAARATELGIPRDRWVFPVASAESNHMVAVSARASLADCPGAEAAGRAALEAARLAPSDIDLIDLYSCFPIAVTAYADAIGVPAGRALTITGGMPFAGGPYNNYVLQAVCRAAEMMRAGQGRTALISCVSGILTKQAACVWSAAPPPNGFARIDVSDAVARRTRTVDVAADFTGEAQVAGCTVVHGGDARRGILLADTKGGSRALATTLDEALIARLESEEMVGRTARLADGAVVALR